MFVVDISSREREYEYGVFVVNCLPVTGMSIIARTANRHIGYRVHDAHDALAVPVRNVVKSGVQSTGIRYYAILITPVLVPVVESELGIPYGGVGDMLSDH